MLRINEIIRIALFLNQIVSIEVKMAKKTVKVEIANSKYIKPIKICSLR